MKLPEFVGIGEMVDMLGLSKTRIQQFIARDDFPEPYLWLQMGRFWQVNDVIEWANRTGRSVRRNIPDRTARPRKVYKRPPRPRVVIDRVIPVDDGTVATNTVAENGMHDGAVNGNAVGKSDEVGLHDRTGEGLHDRTGGPFFNPASTPATISFSIKEPEGTPASSSISSEEILQNQTGVGGVGEGAVPDSRAQPLDQVSNPTPSRRDTMLVDRQALADEWDMLEDLYLRGQKETLTPDELGVYPFAIMVIRAEGNVPTYRKTKVNLIKAWDVVRLALDATQGDLADAARHLMDHAAKPFTAGAVKRFSERRIPEARAQQKPHEAPGPNRWQGSHEAHEAIVATWSDEEKRRWGVIS